MTIRLDDTTAGAVQSAIQRERQRLGATATGMVLTLLIVADEDSQADAMATAVASAREHPMRILGLVPRPGRSGTPARLDAEISVGGDEGPGEVALLRLRGPLAKHTDSVVVPLLLPDTPVVAWWPAAAPAVPASDPIGALATRRITDAAASGRPGAALGVRRLGYRPGDTDLAWTRLTQWRTLLAAALDQPYDPILSAEVSAQRSNPSATLLAAWLQRSLGVPVRAVTSRGPGVTGVTLQTERGVIDIARPDGRLATIARPGWTARDIALPRRVRQELLSEELRRLDPDEVYGETLDSLTELGADEPATTGASG
ncbi:MAG: oxidoreductase [Actinomycetota bacterium]|nr:MAG: oxidoreductase [Actinomycetota bacterium]